MEKQKEISLQDNGKILYRPNDKMPPFMLLAISCQHMLIMLSMGLALPVAVARAAGLNTLQSGSYLAAALFGMGVATILQSIRCKFLGSGYQSMSTADSAAIAACVLAAETGGIPLVLGMSLFSCVVRFVVGRFTLQLRKLFSPIATSTMIMILGINLIPNAFKYSIGTGAEFNPLHLLVAASTFIFMLACTLFIKPLKPYSALMGIIFGYIISLATGVFSFSTFSSLNDVAFVGLPLYSDIAFSFDASMILPFAIVGVAAVVDNIGDFSASQSIALQKGEKINWDSIRNGISGGALGTAVGICAGSSLQSTATANIGVAKATGILSKSVAFGAAILMIVISFFPKLTSILSIIPEPVLGAVLMYSMCYIMSNGFTSMQNREIDDRAIFTIFFTLAAAISTLIPGLYSFLPEQWEKIVASPMNMGLFSIVFMLLLGRIGLKKKYSFVVGVMPDDISALDEQMENIFKQWRIERTFCRKMQIALDALCEGICAQNDKTVLHITFAYDAMQMKVHIETSDPIHADAAEENQDYSIAMMVLKNIFDTVKVRDEQHSLHIDLVGDLD